MAIRRGAGSERGEMAVGREKEEEEDMEMEEEEREGKEREEEGEAREGFVRRSVVGKRERRCCE